MADDESRFDNPRSVSFVRNRWDLRIVVTDNEGVEHEFVASADAGMTGGDGIYFATRQEYDHDAD